MCWGRVWGGTVTQLAEDVPLRPGECVRGRRSLPSSSRGHPSWPAGPHPTWWCSGLAPLPPTAHQLLTRDNNSSVAFQTQTWDLYFSLQINILKAVFFLTVPAQVVFNYLRKAFLAQANLFTVCLVKLGYKPAFRDLLYNIIKKAIFEKNWNHLQQPFSLLCKWPHRSQMIAADHPNLLENAYSKWKC